MPCQTALSRPYGGCPILAAFFATRVGFQGRVPVGILSDKVCPSRDWNSCPRIFHLPLHYLSQRVIDPRLVHVKILNFMFGLLSLFFIELANSLGRMQNRESDTD
jgi:hypothetical protein